MNLLTSTTDRQATAATQPDPISSSTENSHTSPVYPPSPSSHETFTPSSYLRVDTFNPSTEWSFFSSNYTDLLPSSSYTSKIRQRHFSVGSYYDNKTTTVTLHPSHPLYLLSSAPVSPLNRPGTLTTSEFHYRPRHHSPISTGAATYNALRRVNPFFDSHAYEHRRSSSLHRDAYRSTSIETQHTTVGEILQQQQFKRRIFSCSL